MRRHEDNVEPGIEAQKFLSRASVAYRRIEQETEIGHGIEHLDICEPVSKLARSGITQFGCRNGTLLTDFPEFGSMKGKLQSTDPGQRTM
jgi:hypothetical protein